MEFKGSGDGEWHSETLDFRTLCIVWNYEQLENNVSVYGSEEEATYSVGLLKKS
jgi:hypothetical protein